MQLTPVIAIHLSAALAATAIGPVALWARLGAAQRPRMHRAAGYAWVTLMLITALSALFIHGENLAHFHGYSLIHLFVPVVLIGLFGSFWALARRNIALHRRIMQNLYFGGCVGAGVFTLLPSRYLGQQLAVTPVALSTLFIALVVLGMVLRRARLVKQARAAMAIQHI